MSSASSTTLPAIYQNRLLNRLALFCLGGLIQRIGDHYRRWCESLEQHSQALEHGTRVTVDRYQKEINELRQICGGLEDDLRHSRQREASAVAQAQQLAAQQVALEASREADRQRLADLLQQTVELEQRLLEADRHNTSLRQQRDQQQAQARHQTRELSEQRAKARELLTLIDTFRQERAEAVQQRDQQDRNSRMEMAAVRRRLQQRELELEGLRVTLQRQEALFKQRSAQPASSPITIPLPIVRRLLQLCHPDKHDGSEAALEATRWLTAQRQQQRQRVH